MGFPIWAFLLSLGPWLAEAEEPELDVMYLRYKQQPIDTSPVFNRNWLRDLEVLIFVLFLFVFHGFIIPKMKVPRLLGVLQFSDV